MPKKTLSLTSEQEKIIKRNYDKMSLLELTQLVFDDKKLDGRSIQGYTVKSFLVSMGKDVKTTARQPAREIILTDEQKEYIERNISADNGFTEIARVLFENDKLTPLHAESKAVYEYAKNNVAKNYIKESDELALEKYYPPKAVNRLIKLVNESAGEAYDYEKITSIQREEMLSLGRFMAFPLFVHKANNFTTVEKRKIFESTFVSYVYNKPDLSVEEVNQYVEIGRASCRERV
jgi:predicted DNA-binding protein YlxM (UPF0122 family)